MWIMIAGPYTAPTAEERARNLARLHGAAAEVLGRGHVPIVGLSAALPLLGEDTTDPDRHAAVMRLSLALAERCDALLLLARSPGAEREAQAFRGRGLAVYRSIEEIPGQAVPNNEEI
jgi:hypothetical protein